MPEMRQDMSLRGGRKVPVHLYIQCGPAPDDSDPPLVTMPTAALARLVTVAVNEYLRRNPAIDLLHEAGLR